MVGTTRPRPSFLGQAAICGVGYTPFTRSAEGTVLSLATEAVRSAITDAGLSKGQVDGIATFSLWGDSVPAQAVASALAVKDLRYSLDLELGGQAPCFAVAQAAAAVAAGVAETVVVYRALKGRSSLRIGSTRFSSASAQFRYPIGYSAYAQYIAMWARRYMIETGTTTEDLAAVAIAQSRYASENARAVRAGTLSLEQYLASPTVVEPFRAADCTAEVDGACAVVVTTLDRARDLRHKPVVVDSAAWATGPRAGYDIADVQSWPDYSRNCHSFLADRLWSASSVNRSDIDLAEIYDCFSAVVLMTMEGLGLAARGEAGAMTRAGETALGGALPVNTHGGLLREGYVHGMNTVAEAVLQLQGRCGARQVRSAESCVVTSGALMDGSAMVLVGDR